MGEGGKGQLRAGDLSPGTGGGYRGGLRDQGDVEDDGHEHSCPGHQHPGWSQVQQELSSLLKEVPIISWNFIIINNVKYIKLFVDTIITNNPLYNKNPEFRVLSPTKNRNKNLKMLPQFQ